MRNNLVIANAYNSAKKSDDTDAFWTVDWATEILLRNTELSEEVLEPACGEGWISEVLKKHGHKVVSSGINEQRDVKKFKHSGIIAHNWAIWEKNSTKTQFILEK